MLGRAACHEPWRLGEADRRLFGEGDDVTPEAAVVRYLPYVNAELARGTHLAAMTRHMLGLFHARLGARAWRRVLTVESAKPGAGIEVIEHALAALAEAAAHRAEPVPA